MFITTKIFYAGTNQRPVYSNGQNPEHNLKNLHQTNARLAGKVCWSPEGFHATEPNVLELPPKEAACSLCNERARVSSTGVEGGGMCKHARTRVSFYRIDPS